MDNSNLQALVVDDDVVVRNLTIRALTREGFQCDAASDGIEALALADCTDYAAIVTDLRMPNMNGHTLAVELLTRKHRPSLFVLTGVIEPKLAKDLLHRGVADVLFKPVDYAQFATTVKTGVEVDKPRRNADLSTSLIAINATEYEQRLSRIPDVMPVSEAALNVYRMTQSGTYDAQEIAREVTKYEVLATTVRQHANTPLCNPSGTRIFRLDSAVTQIGQRRTGQLALAASAQATVIQCEASLIHSDSVWKRSVAAGIAMELLVARGNYSSVSEGLLTSATVHELGRSLLASLFPEHYKRAIDNCRERSCSILEVEQETLSLSQNEVMCQVLASWDVPSTSYAPLQHIHKDNSAVSRLPEPLRTQTELVRLAVQIARIVTGAWELWDAVDIPPADAVERLGRSELSEIIKETKKTLAGIDVFGPEWFESKSAPARPNSPLAFTYYDASPENYDFLADVLSSMHVRLIPGRKSTEARHRRLVNCIGVHSDVRLPSALDDKSATDALLVCSPQDADYYNGGGRTVIVPTSYAALHNSLAGHERRIGHAAM